MDLFNMVKKHSLAVLREVLGNSVPPLGESAVFNVENQTVLSKTSISEGKHTHTHTHKQQKSLESSETLESQKPI